MKTTTSTLTALAILAGGLMPALPAAAAANATIGKAQIAAPAADEVERRGRKKPRIPGGSGCDDPRDLIEHPECLM